MSDFIKLVQEENLQQKLRIDCFAILMILIQDKDKEIHNIFDRHLNFLNDNSTKYGRFQSKDQSTLLPELLDKTEEVF